jgi:hypothetical protein
MADCGTASHDDTPESVEKPKKILIAGEHPHLQVYEFLQVTPSLTGHR